MSNIINFNKLDIFFKKLFYIDFITYAISMFINMSSLMSIPMPTKIVSIAIKITFLLTFTITFYNIFSGKFKNYELILFFVVGFIFGLQYVFVRSSPIPLLVWFYIYASKGIDFDDLFKKLFVAFVITYTFIVLCRVLGFSKEMLSVNIRYGKPRIRYAFGFGYTCVGSYILLYISLLFIYIKNINIKFFHIIIIFILNTIAFFLTDTKSNYICIIFSIIALLILLQNKNHIFIKNLINFIKKVMSFFAVYIYQIGAIFIIIITLLYEKNITILNILNDKFLTGRLVLGLNAVKEYGISLFGGKASFRGGLSENYNYVDSAYLQVLILNGIIVFIIVSLIFSIVGYVMIKKKNYIGAMIMVVIGAKATIDDVFLSIVYVPYLLLFLDSLEYIVNNIILREPLKNRQRNESIK